MDDKKYPVGTPIVFIAHKSMCTQAQQDDGKRGKIVGETSYGKVKIFLPNSVKNYGNEITWVTAWKNIKPLLQKNQQLLFSFMMNE